MSDWVISAADEATMHGWAQAMGFWADGAPVWQGELPDGSGDYFLNEVGTVYTAGVAQSGWWARLRLNGNDPFADGTLTIPQGITIYPPVKFLADGVTIDTTYVQPAIGVIA